jgi:hypothetical protein
MVEAYTDSANPAVVDEVFAASAVESSEWISQDYEYDGIIDRIEAALELIAETLRVEAPSDTE